MKHVYKIWIIILLIVSGAILSVCFFHNNKMETSKKDNNDGFTNGYQMYEQYIRYTEDGEQRDYIWINEENIEIVFRELDSRLNISDMERLQAVIEKLGQGKEQIDVMNLEGETELFEKMHFEENSDDRYIEYIVLKGPGTKYYINLEGEIYTDSTKERLMEKIGTWEWRITHDDSVYEPRYNFFLCGEYIEENLAGAGSIYYMFINDDNIKEIFELVESKRGIDTVEKLQEEMDKYAIEEDEVEVLLEDKAEIYSKYRLLEGTEDSIIRCEILKSSRGEYYIYFLGEKYINKQAKEIEYEFYNVKEKMVFTEPGRPYAEGSE